MDNRQILNLSTNFVYISISTIISLLLVPFMIKQLGPEAYGFIPLSQQLINYMIVITMALNSMISRYFTIEYKTGKIDDAKEYFNTSLFTAIIMTIVLIIPIIIGAILIDQIFVIPTELITDVRWTFMLLGGIFLFNTIKVTFDTAPFCTNKLYILNLFNTVNNIVKSLLIFSLLKFFMPHIWMVSFTNLITVFLSLITSIYVFKRIMPEIRIVPKCNVVKLKKLLFSGAWVSFNLVGSMLFLQIDLIVANWNLGPHLTGEYSAVLQWPMLLRTFSDSIVPMFVPTVVAHYAEKNIETLSTYVNSSVKFFGLFLSLPIGLVCSMSGPLLSLWLSPSFGQYNWLLSLMTIHLAVNLPSSILMSVQLAADKVKFPAIVTFIMGIGNFCLAYLLSGMMGFGAYGIAGAGAIVLTIKNLIFTPLYCSHITGQKKMIFLKGIMFPIIASTLIIISGFVGQAFFQIDTWNKFIFSSFVISIMYLAFTFFVLLTGEERKRAMTTICLLLKKEKLVSI